MFIRRLMVCWLVGLGSVLLMPAAARAASVDPESWLQRAAIAINANDPALARPYLDALIHAPTANPRQLGLAHLLRMALFLEAEQPRSALLDATRAVAEYPASSEAVTALAFLRWRGIGGEADENEAARLFLKAARQGNALAARMAGEFYLAGCGVKLNSKRAKHWLAAAGDAGDVRAMLRLATHLATDPDPAARDVAAARGWLERAKAQSMARDRGEVDRVAALIGTGHR